MPKQGKYHLEIEIDRLTKIMGNIKEPVGIDLNLSPIPCTDEERKAISAIIAHYKKTGEVLKAAPKERHPKKEKTAAAKRNRPQKTGTSTATAI